MKYLWACVALFGLGVAAGWLIHSQVVKPIEHKKIVYRDRTHTEYKLPPDLQESRETFAKLKECYYSPIEITVAKEQSDYLVTAQDKCKKATRRIGIGYVWYKDWRVQVGIAGALAAGLYVGLSR
jgi:hypothetical protein